MIRWIRWAIKTANLENRLIKSINLLKKFKVRSMISFATKKFLDFLPGKFACKLILRKDFKIGRDFTVVIFVLIIL